MYPAVSVIMPVYNAGKYLHEAIESILNQSFNNFEFVIIDDASIDNSVDIINSFTDSRIKLLFNETNRGIVYSLNKGIENSIASLIARMDADDISLPDRFEKQYNYLSLHPECTLICGWITIIDENGVKSFTQKRYTQNLYFDLIYECAIPHPTAMFKRKAIQELGGYRSVVAEDYDLWSRMVKNYKMVNIEESVLLYRKTNSNLSTVLKTENYNSSYYIVKENINYILKTHNTHQNIIKWLIGDFSNLKHEGNLFLYYKTILTIKRIRNKLLNIENPNKVEENINSAHKVKLNMLLNNFYPEMSKFEKIILLFICGLWKKTIKLLINK